MKKLLVVFAAFLVCCISCGDDDPIRRGPSGSSPVISDLQCPPTSLTLTIGQGGGVFTVAGCSVDFFDEDEDIETILQTVGYTAQDCGEDPLGEISFDVRSHTVGQRQGTIPLAPRIQTDCVAGTYTYEFVALDSKLNESNVLTQAFELVEP